MRLVLVGAATTVVVASLAARTVAAAAPSVSMAPTAQLSPEGASAAVPVTFDVRPRYPELRQHLARNRLAVPYGTQGGSS